MKTTVSSPQLSIAEQVRKMKEDHAAQYGFDVNAIAAAAREWEAHNPERMAKPEDYKKINPT